MLEELKFVFILTNTQALYVDEFENSGLMKYSKQEKGYKALTYIF